MVFWCAIFSDVPGSRRSSENTAALSVFRQKDGLGTPALACNIVRFCLLPLYHRWPRQPSVADARRLALDHTYFSSPARRDRRADPTHLLRSPRELALAAASESCRRGIGAQLLGSPRRHHQRYRLKDLEGHWGDRSTAGRHYMHLVAHLGDLVRSTPGGFHLRVHEI